MKEAIFKWPNFLVEDFKEWFACEQFSIASISKLQGHSIF